MIGLVSWGLTSWFPMLPWFTPFIVAFLFGLTLGKSKSNGFLAGFLGVGIFWCLAALIPHLQNGGILTVKIAAMFSSEMDANITPLVLLIVTSLIGGILGGMTSLSGKLLNTPGERFNRHSKMHKKNRRRGSYKLKLN